jgi:molecular chaperone DnaK
MLDGIPPAPRGVPQVEVSFDIDANGIVSVSAKDKASGKTQTVRIEANTSLSKEEIEKLKAEAVQYADEDRKKKELAEAKNNAENLVYSSEKALKDSGDKVPAEVKDVINQKIAAVKAVKDGQDAVAIKSATDSLSAEIQKIGQAMYGNPQAGGQTPPEAK